MGKDRTLEIIKIEIERRIALYSSLSENTVNPNRIDEDRQILSFLSTLESEKPMNQDEELNNEIKAFVNEYGYEKSEDILLIAIVARHFAQWGAEHLKK